MWNKGTWRNVKSGNTRPGIWYYSWAARTFYVRIKGLYPHELRGADHPEYGNWKLVEGPPNARTHS